MSIATTWVMHVYRASVDPLKGTAYDEVAVSTLAGYSGYATASIIITKPAAKYEAEAQTIVDVSGAEFGKVRLRRVFNVESYPFRYNAGGLQDLTDITALRAVVDNAPYLWVRILGGANTYPSTADYAHPVTFVDWQESINEQAGTRRLTCGIRHRYII